MKNRKEEDLQIQNTTINYTFLNYPKNYEFSNIYSILESIKSRKISHEYKNNDNSYQPLVFHLFGENDALFITEIDKLAYNNKNLLLFRKNKDEDFQAKYNVLKSPIAFHSISGFTLDLNKSITNDLNAIRDSRDSNCLTLTQFKLNSSYLIDYGVEFIVRVVKSIAKILSHHEEIISQVSYSFSAYEITLLLVSDNFDDLNSIIFDLRIMTIGQLEFTGFRDKRVNITDDNSNANTEHLFYDSKTTYGIKLLLDHKAQKLNLPTAGLDLNLSIDWSIKAGRINEFKKELHKCTGYASDSPHMQTLAGTYDIRTNHITYQQYRKIFADLRSNFPDPTKSSLSKLIWKLSSSIILNGRKNNVSEISESKSESILSFTNQEIFAISESLFKKNISDNIRYRILKMFQLFNVGIQNPIKFHVYLDLSPFMINLQEYILTESTYSLSHAKLRIVFEDIINAFEKGYLVRHIDPLTFHGGSNIFIQHNSSIPGLISDIDSIFKLSVFGYKCLLSTNNPDPRKELAHHIVSVDDLVSETTGYRANFDVTSVYYPGLILNLVTKETVVALFKLKRFPHFKMLASSMSEAWKRFVDAKTESGDNWSENLQRSIIYEYVNAEYFLQDYIRFRISFDSNFELFAFWHLVFVLQSPVNYNGERKFSEDKIGLEVTRLMFILFCSSPDDPSIFKKVRDINPFEVTIQRENYLIWDLHVRALTNILPDFISRYDLNNSFLLKAERWIKTYENSNKAFLANEETTMYKQKFELFELLRKNLLNYFNECRELFKMEPKSKAVNRVNIRYCQSDLSPQDETKAFKLLCANTPILSNSLGGLWFKDHSILKKYNNLAFKFAVKLSELAYDCRRLLLKEYQQKIESHRANR